MIDSFSGPYRFLSNFYPAEVTFDGYKYPTVEHAYQAAKTDAAHRALISLAKSPARAKQLGKKVPLRKDWEQVKIQVMLDLLYQKFRNHPDLQEMLLKTGTQELIEGNWWNDRFWGVCNGKGENWLGRLLMQVRTMLSGDLPPIQRRF